MPLTHVITSRCAQSSHLQALQSARLLWNVRQYSRPAFARKPILDIKHIRQNPGLYEVNCMQRNVPQPARNGWKVLELYDGLATRQREVLSKRQRNKLLIQELKSAQGNGRDALLAEARLLKEELAAFEQGEKRVHEEIETLALELPNLSSLESPVGDQPQVKGYINGNSPPERKEDAVRSHVEIGKQLDILDFDASNNTSGWGWYFLKNEGALLEQALIQYALSIAMKHGWSVQTPPSLVYSHVASACGFMPRDPQGETQIYSIELEDDAGDRPRHVLAGTAEIPFAGSQAYRTLDLHTLPMKVVGPSRCYRAEAGARGVDTKGLYRVHEFTKVEMFAWTEPSHDSSDEADRFQAEDDSPDISQAETVFNDLLSVQLEILTELGLHARILEMPTADLGAAAQRKMDIEVFFPSRISIDNGYGEVSSASICTDFQTRRTLTRLKDPKKQGLSFPWTLNGTAMAVPRVLAAILENGWDPSRNAVRIPRCLQKWMPGEMEYIAREE